MKNIIILLLLVLSLKCFPFTSDYRIKFKQVNNINEIILENLGKKTSIIYPLYISNLKNNIDIIRDECAFLSLEHLDSCKVYFKSSTDYIRFKFLINNKDIVYKIKNNNKIKKKIREYNLILNDKKYYKLGLGFKYNISYKSNKKDLIILLNNKSIKYKKQCNKKCIYSFSILHDKETMDTLLIDNKKISLNFALRIPSKVSIKNKQNKYFNNKFTDIKLETTFISGLPKHSFMDKSLYYIIGKNVLNSNRLKNKLGITKVKIKYNNTKTITSNINFYKTFPFSDKKIYIAKGEEKTINLDLENDFSMIKNYGKLNIISKSNLSVLGVGTLINYGVINIIQSSEIRKNKMTILLDKQNYQMKELECKTGKCLFIFTHNQISQGKINKNKIKIYANNTRGTSFLRFVNKKKTNRKKQKMNKHKIYTGIGILKFVLRFMLGILFFIAFPLLFKRKRISDKKIILKQEIKHIFISLFNTVFVIGFIVIFIVNPLNDLGMIKLYYNISDYPLWWYLSSFILIVIIHDAYFYFLHRLIHYGFLYKYIHEVHHRITNVTATASFSFHILEAFLLFLFAPLILLIMPIHVHVLSFFLVWMTMLNCYGHSGFYLVPNFLRKNKIFKNIFILDEHHFYHHSRNNGNFGLYFRYLDKWLGTEDPKYTEKIKDE